MAKPNTVSKYRVVMTVAVDDYVVDQSGSAVLKAIEGHINTLPMHVDSITVEPESAVREIEPARRQRVDVDAATLNDEEIRAGVLNQGRSLGSFGYYMQEEINRCLADRAGIVAYRDELNRLRIYYRSRADRKAHGQ